MNYTTFDRIQQLKFCCPFDFFDTFRSAPTWKLALVLNITPRAVRLWRHRYRAHTLTPCPKCIGKKR